PLRALPVGERGWITLSETRALFPPMNDQYAFGEMDEVGKTSLAAFAAESDHRSAFDLMPVRGAGLLHPKGTLTPRSHCNSNQAASSNVGQLVTAPLHSARCGRSRGAHRTHSSPIPPLLVCGAGATCGVAGGSGGLACTGGSTACDGGPMRR